MAGKGGGAWKVAYADFVTAMMAFFLVMWIVAQSKPVKEAVANYFKNPSGSGRAMLKGKGDSMLPLNNGGPSPLGKNPLHAPKTRPSTQPAAGDADVVEERTSSRPNRIALAGDESLNVGTQVIFAEESAELDKQSEQALDLLIPSLLGKFSKIELRGHASGRRLPADSPYQSAWELSYARSMAAMKYLIEKGIDPRRVRLSQSGSNDPNLMVDDSNGGVKNARVEVYVLNEVVTPASDAEERRNVRSKKIGPKRPQRPKPPTAEATPAETPAAAD